MKTAPEIKYSIKKNDLVEVIGGREKGKSGKVLVVSAKTGRVTIERVNMVKKHVKPNQKNPQGGVIEKELGIHYSNVLLMCSKCNRGVRHGHKMVEAGAAKKGAKKGAQAEVKMKKIRVCKRCSESLETA